MSTATAISIRVNDRLRSFAADGVLADVLRELGVEGRKGIALAVNGRVVSRSEWAARKLAGGDKILVIQATQGG